MELIRAAGRLNTVRIARSRSQSRILHSAKVRSAVRACPGHLRGRRCDQAGDDDDDDDDDSDKEAAVPSPQRKASGSRVVEMVNVARATMPGVGGVSASVKAAADELASGGTAVGPLGAAADLEMVDVRLPVPGAP